MNTIAHGPVMYFNWRNAWIEVLNRTDATTLSEHFVKRWRENASMHVPSELHFDQDELPDAEWSEALQLFLLDERSPQELVSLLCNAVGLALEKFEFDIRKGDVWLTDLLALRRARNTSNELRQQICTRFSRAIEGMSGILPEPDLNQYHYLSKIYRRVTECAVTELYEEDQIRFRMRAGFSKVPFESFSLFYLLELDRKCLFDHGPDGNYQLPKSVSQRYQASLDGVFDTLLTLSLLSVEASPNNKKRFFDVVKLVCRDRLNDIASQLGLQRRLDIHWLRICTVVSRKKYSEAKLVFQFIRKIARASEQDGIEVVNCVLDMRSSLPFKSIKQIPSAKLISQEGTLRAIVSPELEAKFSEEAV